MRCTEPTTTVGMEVFVEPDVVTEMWICVELRVPTVRSTPSLGVTSKYMDDTMLNLLSDIGQIHVVTATRRAFDLQIITVVLIEPLQTLNQEEVHREP